MKFDHTFQPLRQEVDKFIVASEAEWSEFEALANGELNPIGFGAGIYSPAILIEGEPLFSGYEGPIYEGEPFGPTNEMHRHSVNDEMNIKTGRWWKRFATTQDIITRLFKIIDQSDCEFYLNVGASWQWFTEFKEDVEESRLRINIVPSLRNLHIGTTPEHQASLEPIKHLCAGTFITQTGEDYAKSQ